MQPRTRKVHAARIINSPPSLLRRNLPVRYFHSCSSSWAIRAQSGEWAIDQRQKKPPIPAGHRIRYRHCVYPERRSPFCYDRSSDLFVVITGKSMASTIRCGLENSGKTKDTPSAPKGNSKYRKWQNVKITTSNQTVKMIQHLELDPLAKGKIPNWSGKFTICFITNEENLPTNSFPP